MSRSRPSPGFSPGALWRAALRGTAAGAMLGVLTILNPGRALGQGSGTLRVSARVLDADPAWEAVELASGWSGAAAPTGSPSASLLSLTVSSAAADSGRPLRRQVVVTIQYLRN